MATTFITGAVTTQQTVSAFSELVITQTGIISTTTGDAITSSGRFTTTYVAGEVYGQSHAIFMDDFDFGFGAHVVHVAAGGIVASFNESAIELESNGNRIFNDGSISSVFSNAVPVIQFNGNRATVINNGSIAGSSGINMTASESSTTPSQVTNTGTIMTENHSIRASNQTLELVNSGTIDSSNTDAVEMLTAHSLRVVNIGVIAAQNGESAINANNASDEVINSGLIDGNVSLAGGTDLFDGRGGTVNGEVRGGSGDDIYIIDDIGIVLFESSGQGTDEVQSLVNHTLGDNFETLTLLGSDDLTGNGNSDANTLTGNGGANTLFGDTGDDTIDGGAGADTIDGGSNNDSIDGGYGDDMLLGRANNDLVLGNNGDDTLNGGTGNDTLRGGNDDDVLAGGRNNDRLFGGNGDDLVVGGAGSDTMFGEGGRDTFCFRQADDSPTGSAADRIMDFELGIDRIKLSDFGLDASTLSFGGGFVGGGTASGQAFTAGADTRVLIDDDGDGVADFHLTVVGVTGLDLGDFIL